MSRKTLTAAVLAVLVTGLQAQSPKPKPAPAKDDGIYCLVEISVTRRVSDEKVHYEKPKPVDLLQVTLAGTLTSIKPKDPARTDTCQVKTPFDDNTPVLFTLADAARLTLPSRIEVLYVNLALGFAYYGIPNPQFFQFLRVLPQ